jgi:hypothetical protein
MLDAKIKQMYDWQPAHHQVAAALRTLAQLNNDERNGRRAKKKKKKRKEKEKEKETTRKETDDSGWQDTPIPLENPPVDAKSIFPSICRLIMYCRHVFAAQVKRHTPKGGDAPRSPLISSPLSLGATSDFRRGSFENHVPYPED